jgi:lysozyme
MNKLSPEGSKLIKFFEGLKKVLPDGKIAAYICPAGVPTIGYGSTMYPNGQKVNIKDVITLQRAEEIFAWHVGLFEKDVNSLVKTILQPHQFDALVSFAYNLGSDIDADLIAEGLGDSTLLKKVNANPNDPTIKDEFVKWNKAGGHVLAGLTKRRQMEADLYFTR